MAPDRGVAFADVAKGSVLTLSLFLAYITFPILGVAAGMMSPLPALIYSIAGGKVRGVVIVVISAAVVLGVAGPAAAAMYVVQSGVPSITLAFLLGRKEHLSRAIAGATFACVVSALLFAVSYSLSVRGDLHGQIVEGVNASTRQAVDVYAKSGVTGEDLASLESAMAQVGRILTVAYPALLIIFLGTVSGVTVLLLRRFGSKWGIALPDAEFSEFRLPELLVWPVIVAGFSLFVQMRSVQLTAYNVLAVLTVLYFIQGLAVVVAFFKRSAVPALVRVVFYLLVGVQPYLAVVIAILGLFDIWGNFRVPRHKNL